MRALGGHLLVAWSSTVYPRQTEHFVVEEGISVTTYLICHLIMHPLIYIGQHYPILMMESCTELLFFCVIYNCYYQRPDIGTLHIWQSNSFYFSLLNLHDTLRIWWCRLVVKKSKAKKDSNKPKRRLTPHVSPRFDLLLWFDSLKREW